MNVQMQEKYADRIAKLLRKAESTTPEEAELLVAKAQELMVQYAIDEELIRNAKGENAKTQEEVICAKVDITGIYRKALMQVASAIVYANDCTFVYRELSSTTRADGTKRPSTVQMDVIGVESDVRRVEMLNASLQIQVASAQARWWKVRKPEVEWMSGMDKFKERREFIFGFADGLRSQLREARKKGQEAAKASEAERARARGEENVEAAASESVAMVVRSKKERVQDYVDKSYGRLRSSSSRRSTGSGAARGAGSAAGRAADAGRSGRIGGNRGQLGRG